MITSKFAIIGAGQVFRTKDEAIREAMHCVRPDLCGIQLSVEIGEWVVIGPSSARNLFDSNAAANAAIQGEWEIVVAIDLPLEFPIKDDMGFFEANHRYQLDKLMNLIDTIWHEDQ